MYNLPDKLREVVLKFKEQNAFDEMILAPKRTTENNVLIHFSWFIYHNGKSFFLFAFEIPDKQFKYELLPIHTFPHRSKSFLQFMVHTWSKSKVVNKHNSTVVKVNK